MARLRPCRGWKATSWWPCWLRKKAAARARPRRKRKPRRRPSVSVVPGRRTNLFENGAVRRQCRKREDWESGEDSGNATQFHKTEAEAKNASRGPQALQGHRHRQGQAHAFGEASPARHQEARAHAQTQEADDRESGGSGQREADAPVWRLIVAKTDCFRVSRFRFSCQAALHGCLPAELPGESRARQASEGSRIFAAAMPRR